jgi:AcrR family transcriptional regulator
MPRPKKSAAEITAMREQILDAALTLLQEQGIEDLSIRKIADQIGVSHMSLYTYFDNRAAIVQALRERGFQQMEAFCSTSLHRAETGDALEQVRASLAWFIRLSHDHPQLYQLAWRRANNGASFRVDSRNLTKVLEHLTSLIQLGIARGQCVHRDPTVAAVMTFSIINGTLMLYHNIAAMTEVQRDLLEAEMMEAAMTYLTQQDPKSLRSV